MCYPRRRSRKRVVYFRVPVGQASTQCPHPTQRELITGFPSRAADRMSICRGQAVLHLPQSTQRLLSVVIRCPAPRERTERTVPRGQAWQYPRPEIRVQKNIISINSSSRYFSTSASIKAV